MKSVVKMNNEVIQVFVGCDPNNCDLEQMMVLEYSLRKHTSHPVNITWMQLSHDTNSQRWIRKFEQHL